MREVRRARVDRVVGATPRHRQLATAGGVALVASLVLGGTHVVSVRAQARQLAIHDIQGAGARSPHEGAVVSTTGVVTGRKSNGFFIQTPDGATDGRETTSEGLFVFTASTPPANVLPGTLVGVTGRVVEFVPAADPTSPPLTQLADASAIEVRGAGLSLPPPLDLRTGDLVPPAQTLGDASSTEAVEALERFEGMRVRVASLTTVSPTLGSVSEVNATATSNGVFYGVITGGVRPFRKPGIDVRSALPPTAPCCVPRQDGNPDRLRVDSDGQPGAAAINVGTGAVIANVIGPLDYGFRTFTLLPDPGLPPQVTSAPSVEPPRRATDDEFAVASLNLQRLFDANDDPGIGEPVLSTSAFANRLRKISLYARRVLRLPPIVGVQEVENLATLQALAAALNRDAREARELKPHYEAFVAEGNDPGGIDVGLLVDRARVDIDDVTQEGRTDQFRNPAGQLELLHDRPPLVLRARVWAQDGTTRPLTIVVAHMRSLIDIDHPTNGARVRAKRAAQAEALAALVDRRQRADPREWIIVMGDLNAFEFSDGYVDVVGTMRGAPTPADRVVQPTRDLLDPDLVNLLDLLPAGERYSYVFDGVAQTLDHVLVSPSVLPWVSAFGYVRGNADAAEVWRGDATRPERVSDHDAPLIYIRSR